jgi:hypothetical protein
LDKVGEFLFKGFRIERGNRGGRAEPRACDVERALLPGNLTAQNRGRPVWLQAVVAPSLVPLNGASAPRVVASRLR